DYYCQVWDGNSVQWVF
nr:immunoglobulin light chain junction region [Macaca mulatta]